jgi:hypothetical protein
MSQKAVGRLKHGEIAGTPVNLQNLASILI